MWKRDQSVKPPDTRRDLSTAAAVDRGPLEKVVMDLGTSLVIKGDVSASEDLTLYGQIEGTITLSPAAMEDAIRLLEQPGSGQNFGDMLETGQSAIGNAND